SIIVNRNVVVVSPMGMMYLPMRNSPPSAITSAIPIVPRGTNGVTIARKKSPTNTSIAPMVTGSIRLRSAWLPREESAVVARSPVTYVCVGPPSLAFQLRNDAPDHVLQDRVGLR